MLLLSLVLAGCSTLRPPKELPSTFTAAPTQAEFTGWMFDRCQDNRPVWVSDVRISLECFPFGGEIYKVRLADARSTDGTEIPKNLLLVPRSALSINRWHLGTWRFSVTEAPPALQEATGARYIATSYRPEIEQSP